jgi:multimeric flavodoxin WrbA
MEKAANVRLLAIYGSPRKGGNTDILLDRALEAALSRGAEVERLYVRKLRIRGCIGCGGCAEEGHCVLDDAMQDVYPSLEVAHRLVLGVPVYFYGVPSGLKALIDRCQAYWSRKYVLRKPIPDRIGDIERRGYVISIAASHGQKVFDGVVLTARIFFDALNMELGGELLVRGVDAKGAILEHPNALKRALELGRKMALETG